MQLHKSKMCFNSHLDIDNYSGNMRLFEGTGSGCLMITNYTADLKNHFNDDEIISYNSKEDALEKIKYLLNNPKKKLKIFLQEEEIKLTKIIHIELEQIK